MEGLSFSTPRLTVVPLSLSHVDAGFAALADPRIYAYIPDEPPADAAALERQWARYLAGPQAVGQQWLNATVWLAATTQVIGTVQATLDTHSGVAEIAYLLCPAVWGEGYGTEAVLGLTHYLFRTAGAAIVEARVDVRNRRSWGLLERLGFARAETILRAACFKGSPSDEYLYRCGVPNLPP